MRSKESIPTDIEISQISYDKDSADKLLRLATAEEATMRSVKDLGDKIEKSAKERKAYNEAQFEMSRNYIQLVNRHSTIFQSSDLQKLKEHLRQNEESIIAMMETASTIHLLGDSYKEYVENIKECLKSWQRLIKAESDWYNASVELTKAKDKYDTEKLDKIEKSMGKLKLEVEKHYTDKNHRHEFIEKSMQRVNQNWQKLKMVIKNVGW